MNLVHLEIRVPRVPKEKLARMEFLVLMANLVMLEKKVLTEKPDLKGQMDLQGNKVNLGNLETQQDQMALITLSRELRVLKEVREKRETMVSARLVLLEYLECPE